MTLAAPRRFADGAALYMDDRLMVKPFDGRLGRVFFVHDAAWVADEEIPKAGGARRSPTVFVADTFEEAEAFCRRVEAGEIRTEPHESNFVGWPALRKRVQRAYAEGRLGARRAA